MAILGTQVVVRGAALVAFLIIARTIPLPAFAPYALTLALIELARPLADLGIGGATVRLLASTPSDRWATVIATSLRLRVLAAILVASVGLALTTLPELVPYRGMALIVAGAVMVSAIANNRVAPFQAALRMPRVGMVYGLAALVHLAGVILGSIAGWTVMAFIAWYVAQEVLIALGLHLRVRREFAWSAAPAVDGTIARRLARDGVALGVIALLSVAYFRIDLLMLEGWTTAEEVGRYGVAYRLCEALLLVQVAISTSAFARYAALPGVDGPAGAALFGVLARILMGIGTLLAIGLVLLAPRLVPLYLPPLASSLPLIAILVWAIALTFANAAIVDRLLAAGATTPVLGIAAINLLVNIGLNLILIPRFGAIGAASATVVTEAVGAILFVMVQFRRDRRSPPLDAWIMLLAAAAAHAAVVMRLPWVAVGAIGIVLVSAVMLIRGLRRDVRRFSTVIG